jgi:hypothetical protein
MVEWISATFHGEVAERELMLHNQALGLKRAVGDRSGEALTLGSLMDLCGDTGKPALAIFYGKQVINAYQQLRSNMLKELEPILKYHQRDSVIQLKVLRAPTATAVFLAGVQDLPVHKTMLHSRSASCLSGRWWNCFERDARRSP